MSDKKHSGENVIGVTLQMRFVPLKVDEEQPKRETCKISVRIVDSEKGTADNLRVLELPCISKMELEGEVFVSNRIKLTNVFFQPKGWTKADSLTKRLEKYATFMKDRAKGDFMLCQKKVRTEFVEFYDFHERESDKADTLKGQ